MSNKNIFLIFLATALLVFVMAATGGVLSGPAGGQANRQNINSGAAAATQNEPEEEPPRPFPEWFDQIGNMPAWVLGVDEFPDWFYELPEEPFWFATLTRIPAWFYTLTEIPGWFYPEPEPETEPPTQRPTAPPTERPTERSAETTTADESGIRHPFDDDYVFDYDYIPGYDYSNDDYSYDYDDESEAFPTTFAFQYPAGTLYSSVPNGLITSGEARFRGDFESLFVTQDDLPFEWNGGIIFSHGDYRVYYSEAGEEFEGAEYGTEILRFRIITRPVGDLGQYTIPENFSLQSVSYEGENVVLDSEGIFYPELDGVYTFTVGYKENPLFFTSEITVKRTPPVILFEGLDDNMTSEEPVVYRAEEAGVSVRAYHDGVEIPVTGMVSLPGRYLLTAEDVAGNVSEYEFRLFYVMNISGVWVIVIASAMIAAIIGYCVYCRVKVRVR
ncbi:MAG: hypothetical protein FWH10_05820 [Oscillospiraceae bacterium]|nr:hypothetical protein [Oscillospiraceae bacterium]